MNKAMFIAFEGIDGSGKSTQAKLLSKKLHADDLKVHLTYEPTDSEIGRLIRDAFSGKKVFNDKTIAGLFVADRLEHILNENEGLLRYLADDFTVICDRYYFSSYAYQGVFTSMDWVIAANKLSADLLRPDLTIFIDVNPAVSMARINANRSVTELYENLENLEKVRQNYFQAFDKLKDEENIFIVDGSSDPEIVSESIWEKITSML